MVVRLDDSLQDQNCSVIIDNIQSFLVSSSSSLFSSLAGKFYLSQIFSVVAADNIFYSISD